MSLNNYHYYEFFYWQCYNNKKNIKQMNNNKTKYKLNTKKCIHCITNNYLDEIE